MPEPKNRHSVAPGTDTPTGDGWRSLIDALITNEPEADWAALDNMTPDEVRDFARAAIFRAREHRHARLYYFALADTYQTAMEQGLERGRRQKEGANGDG